MQHDNASSYLRWIGKDDFQVEQPFFIAEDEVSFDAFMKFYESLAPGQREQYKLSSWSKVPSYKPDDSVREVSWNAAREYVAWLAEHTGCKGRLEIPSADEWAVAVLYADTR
jgi:formylglycine-generating enzyme required for sulfatase activity